MTFSEVIIKLYSYIVGGVNPLNKIKFWWWKRRKAHLVKNNLYTKSFLLTLIRLRLWNPGADEEDNIIMNCTLQRTIIELGDRLKEIRRKGLK